MKAFFRDLFGMGMPQTRAARIVVYILWPITIPLLLAWAILWYFIMWLWLDKTARKYIRER